MNRTFNRNPEALATSKTTVQRRVHQSPRPPHPVRIEQRVVVDASCAKTLADQIAAFEGALTAPQLAKVLSISNISLYKMAKSGRIPCVRIGASVRFCPATVARWLRQRGG